MADVQRAYWEQSAERRNTNEPRKTFFQCKKQSVSSLRGGRRRGGGCGGSAAAAASKHPSGQQQQQELNDCSSVIVREISDLLQWEKKKARQRSEDLIFCGE